MNTSSQQLGLLGLGSRSTQHYIGLMNARYNAIHGGYSTCPFVMLNVDFDRINPFLPDDFEHLEPVALDVLREAQSLGIGRLIIPNITLHIAVDRVLKKLEKPLHIVHPVELTAATLRKAGHQKVTVLGTRHTMRPCPLWDAFMQHGIELQTPPDSVFEVVEKYRNQTLEGAALEHQAWVFSWMLKAFELRPVVVACTELSLLLTDPVNEGVFDMARIQVEWAVGRP